MSSSQVSAVQGIRDEIAGRLNEIESDNTDQYNLWINLGLRDVALSFPNAPFLQTSANFTLSSGQRIYTNIVTSAERINQITIPQTQTKVNYVSPEQFDIIAPSATQGGMPTIWTCRGLVSNGTFEFYPVPGSTYSAFVDYEMSIATVSASTDKPNIPVKYYELLVMYGESRGLRRQKRYDTARQVDADYQMLKQRMMEDLLRQTSQMGRIMSVRELQAGQNISVDPIQNAFFGTFN